MKLSNLPPGVTDRDIEEQAGGYRETVDDILRDLVASGGVGLGGVAAAFRKQAARLRELEAERDALRALLREARDDIACWGGYASEYFQKKHDLAGDLASIDAFLAGAKP